MIVLTGDTHRDFDRIEVFCEENCTTKDDILTCIVSSMNSATRRRQPLGFGLSI